jgi:hypothetical protein
LNILKRKAREEIPQRTQRTIRIASAQGVGYHFFDTMKVFTKWLRRLLPALVILYAAFVSAVWWSMHQPPETFGRVMARMPGPAVFLLAPFETMWTHARAGTLNPGDPAPDFSLMKLDRSERIQLSWLITQGPVVLVFGSYT